MMFNVPLPGGTTGHAAGGAPHRAAAGPRGGNHRGFCRPCRRCFYDLAASCPLVPTAFNMAFVLPFVAAIVSRALNSRLHDKSWGTSVSAIVSGWVGLCLAALCAAIEFGIQPMLFTNASGAPAVCPFPLSIAIPAMMIPHMLVAGVVEGVATAAIYAFIKKTAPSIIAGPRPLTASLLLMALPPKKDLADPPRLSWLPYLSLPRRWACFATGDAWGEWDGEGAATAVQEAGDDSLQASVGLDAPDLCRFVAHGRLPAGLFRGSRVFGFAGQAAMYILSGVIGVAVLTIGIPSCFADGKGKRVPCKTVELPSWLAAQERYEPTGARHRVMQKERPAPWRACSSGFAWAAAHTRAGRSSTAPFLPFRRRCACSACSSVSCACV